MSHLPLGNTGLNVAPLSLGTVKLGRDQGVKYPNPVKIPDDANARRLLDTARDLGINLLDTAPAYGNSEERLGQLLAGQRQHWLLCTKVGEDWVDNRSVYNFTPEHCRFSVARSLRRLQTDYVDLVLIHSDGQDLDILHKHGTLQALAELKAQGMVRLIGMSHKTVAGAEAAIDAGADVIMATLNRDHLDEVALIAAAAQRGVGVLIKKALASGHGRAQDLAWVAQHDGVHSIVVGTSSPEHLRQNAALLGA